MKDLNKKCKQARTRSSMLACRRQPHFLLRLPLQPQPPYLIKPLERERGLQVATRNDGCRPGHGAWLVAGLQWREPRQWTRARESGIQKLGCAQPCLHKTVQISAATAVADPCCYGVRPATSHAPAWGLMWIVGCRRQLSCTVAACGTPGSHTWMMCTARTTRSSGR